MVIDMIKYTFLVYHKEYHDFLNRLQEVGVLHVVEKQAGALPENEELRSLMTIRNRFQAAYASLKETLQDNRKIKPVNLEVDGLAVCEQFEALSAKRAALKHQQAALQKEADRIMPWGNFSIDLLDQLRASGLLVRFFTCQERIYSESWEEDYNAIRINQIGSTVYFITLTKSEVVVDIDLAEKVKIPAKSYNQIIRELQSIKQEEESLNKQIYSFAVEHYRTIKHAYQVSEENIEFSKVLLNSESQADEKLIMLTGWVPVDAVDHVNDYLDKEGYYYQAEKATVDDNPPVKLKNNKFTRMFEAIGELYDMPNYHELDLTVFFAPFFLMFFGLCLGDAGYGLFIAVAALFVRRKMKPAIKPLLTLAFWLGIATVIFGTISGSFFGIELLKVDWPWIQRFKTIMLSPDQLFNLSLIIGAVQIIFGMFIKAFSHTKRFGFKNVLPTWGWLILIVGGGITFGMSEKQILTPETTRIIYIVVFSLAGICIFLLNNLKRNPLINIGAGLWDTYNMATGLLGDMLSYIRLFALGISGSVMGLVFNDLAMSMKPDNIILGPIVMLIILIFGHGINIFMAGLGAFVHPMRLTFVEFYKNAGFQGGGKKYKPFAKHSN